MSIVEDCSGRNGPRQSPSIKSLRGEKPGPLRRRGARVEIAGIVASAYVEDGLGPMNEAGED
ncbi:MAG: hypothetical protein ABIK09_13985, partial [Pseudomonadota bacterium]